MKRIITIVFLVLIALGVVLAGVIYSWTFTPHGRLDAEVAVLLKLIPDPIPAGEESVQEQRRKLRNATERFGSKAPGLHKVEDRDIPRDEGKIPIRIYWPTDEKGLPLLLYYHGGGFTVGDLDTHDHICRILAERSKAIVLSVDYRLAPEDTFPAAADDAYGALQWVSQHAVDLHGDPTRIAVGGDSAGGNLAAVTALRARDHEGPKIIFQLLVYPRTNMGDNSTPSWENFQDGYFLTRDKVDFYRSLYLPKAVDWQHPYASPALAEDHSNLPPALVITAGFDPLRDEGEAYARKLAEAGVPARSSRYEGVIHGFFGIGYIRKSDVALDEAAAALREAFEK
jgi:acetyl esterase